MEEHKTQLQHMRSEYDSKLADQRAQIERDLGIRMNAELEKARIGWEKEHQDAKYAINKVIRVLFWFSLASVDVYPFLAGFIYRSNASRKQDKQLKMPDDCGKNNSDKK